MRRTTRIGTAIVVAVTAGSMLAPPVAAGAFATFTYTGAVRASGVAHQAHHFFLTTDGPIQATLAWSKLSANLNLSLFTKEAGHWARIARSSTPSRPEAITVASGSAGQWKVGVRAASGGSAYEVEVTFPGDSAPTQPSSGTVLGGGLAGHASMYPSGVDVDVSGNVYVADTGDDIVDKRAPGGGVIWRQGSRGPKASGRFENPRDVAVLGAKVYVADTGYNRIQVLDAGTGEPVGVWPTRFGSILGVSVGVDGTGKNLVLVAENTANSIRVFSPDGSPIRSIGHGPGSGPGELDEPRDAATDADGNVYVADYRNSRIAVFEPNGDWIEAWGVNGTGPGQLKRPYGVDLDDSGDVYVADSNNRIHRFTKHGAFVRAYGVPGERAGEFAMLRRVAVAGGAHPNVYGADLWRYKIEVFDDQGTHLQTIGGDPPNTGAFNEPYGVVIAGPDLFVVDMVNQRVQRFDADSLAFERAWGERGWGEGNPGYNWPKGITSMRIGGAVHLWVADTKNNRVSEFLTGGTPTGRVFGKVGAGIGQLHWPFSVAAFRTNLVVADSENDRVQLWNPSGPGVVWSRTGAAGAAFAKPKAVCVHAGLVYVADTQNHRVVVLNAATGAFVRAFGGPQLLHADGVAVEPNTGDVWVSDAVRQRLVEFSSTGTWIQNFGEPGSAVGQFNRPYHMVINPAGDGTSRLFVTDSWNDRVQRFRV